MKSCPALVCASMCICILNSICARINNIYLAHSIKLLQQISIQHYTLSCCFAPGVPPSLMVLGGRYAFVCFSILSVWCGCCCCCAAINLVESFRLLLIQAIEHMCPPAADCACSAASAVVRCGMPHLVNATHLLARTHMCAYGYVVTPLPTVNGQGKDHIWNVWILHVNGFMAINYLSVCRR